MTRYDILGDTRYWKIRDVVYNIFLDMILSFDTRFGVIQGIERYEIWGYNSYGKIRNVV